MEHEHKQEHKATGTQDTSYKTVDNSNTSKSTGEHARTQDTPDKRVQSTKHKQEHRQNGAHRHTDVQATQPHRHTDTRDTQTYKTHKTHKTHKTRQRRRRHRHRHTEFGIRLLRENVQRGTECKQTAVWRMQGVKKQRPTGALVGRLLGPSFGRSTKRKKNARGKIAGLQKFKGTDTR